MVRCTPDLIVNPLLVASVAWERRHYMNCAGDSVLLITMVDGTVHRVRHEPHLMGGTDGYDVERRIIAGFEAAQVAGMRVEA